MRTISDGGDRPAVGTPMLDGPAVEMRAPGLLRSFLDFVLTLFRRRFLISEMALRDIASQHVASTLGFFWTLIHPAMTIVILWIVFDLGFRVVPTKGVPFVVWLTAGMAIWNTFLETVTGSTRMITANPYLVKKVVFPLSILPVVKLIASLVAHFVFLAILLVLMAFYRLPPSIYSIQAIYYFLAMTTLALGLSWITSSLNVFFRDTAQIVTLLLQFGFWMTPVFWDIDIMPVRLRPFFVLNPMYYVVQGYRDSFLYSVPFWHHGWMTCYYWLVAASVFVIGALMFRRLKPHFADVV